MTRNLGNHDSQEGNAGGHSHIVPARSPSCSTATVKMPRFGHNHDGLRPVRKEDIIKRIQRTTEPGRLVVWYQHVHEFDQETK